MTVKIGPIPDRSPAKLALSLSPETYAALADYAAVHAKTYGSETPVAELAAIMIERFLAADAGFRRARKTLGQVSKAKE